MRDFDFTEIINNIPIIRQKFIIRKQELTAEYNEMVNIRNRYRREYPTGKDIYRSKVKKLELELADITRKVNLWDIS